MKTQYTNPFAAPFVGRSSELTDVHKRLSDSACRLLTITGLGGSGKTRLAIEVAHTLEEHFHDGVVFVALQAVTRLDLLLSALAQAVGLSFYGSDEPETQLFNYLHEKSLLLVLDNFEHLLNEVIFLSSLLHNTKRVKLLVTSREVLNLQEEWLYPLKGLTAPPSMYSTELEDYEAVQLFLYHAQRVQPNFDVIGAREAIIQICRITEGLPLAIEIVAMWAKTFSPAQIAQQIQHNLDFVSTGARNMAERHRSMRVVFDQTWQLLSQTERLAFAKLSVFQGGFDLQAAEQIGGASLVIVSALVEKSLLWMSSVSQLRIHELARQYGKEQLDAMDLTETVRTVHSAYYTDFLSRRAPDLKTQRQREALDEISIHFENIRAAWEWALQAQLLQHLTDSFDGLFTFYELQSQFHEGDALLAAALETLPHDRFLRSRLLAQRANIKISLGQYEVAQQLLDESVTLAQATDDSEQLAYGLQQLARTKCYLGDYATAERLCQQSLNFYDERDDSWGKARCLHVFGFILSRVGNIRSAQQCYREAVTLFRNLGDTYYLNSSLLNLGVMCATLSENAEARLLLEESLSIARKSGNRLEIARAMDHLGMLLVWGFKDYNDAQSYYEQSLLLRREIGDLPGVAHTLNNMGDTAVKMKNFEQAQTFYNEALALFQQHSDPWNITIALAGLGDALTGLGQYDVALEYFRTALQKSVDLQAKVLTLSLFVSVIILFTKLKKWELAAALTSLIIYHPDSPPGLKHTARAYFTADADATISTLKMQLDNPTQAGTLVNMRLDELAQMLVLPSTYLRDLSMPLTPVQTATPPSYELLTPRELEILHLMATGLTNPQIAAQLFIGSGTVKTHTLNIYRKLDVANRTQAILRAQELGLLSS